MRRIALGSALLLGLAACRRPEPPGSATMASASSAVDSASNPMVAALLADRRFREPVDLQRPTLVLYAVRRGITDTALTPDARQVLGLADSIAPFAARLDVAVVVRAPPYFWFRAPGRLIPAPDIDASAPGFVLAAPDTPLTITRGLPSLAVLRTMLEEWHAAWKARHSGSGANRAT